MYFSFFFSLVLITYIVKSFAAPVGSVSPVDEVRTLFNISAEPLNDTSWNTPNEQINYPVPGSNPPMNLTFWRFGSVIPEMQFLLATAKAGKKAETLAEEIGHDPLPFGVFMHETLFPTGYSINITIADHSQVHRPMNFYEVLDALIGLASFPVVSERQIREADFWIDVKGVNGEVGFGGIHLERRRGVTLTETAIVEPTGLVRATNPIVDAE